ncbi:hypothetical protein ACTXT7_017586 [Hymenolepis weldensis]
MDRMDIDAFCPDPGVDDDGDEDNEDDENNANEDENNMIEGGNNVMEDDDDDDNDGRGAQENPTLTSTWSWVETSASKLAANEGSGQNWRSQRPAFSAIHLPVFIRMPMLPNGRKEQYNAMKNIRYCYSQQMSINTRRLEMLDWR